MTDLDASPLSQKAIAFRHETNKGKRERLFIEICAHYLPKIKRQMEGLLKQDVGDYLQIYYAEVHMALIKWKLTSNFNTYLYPYVQSVPRKFMASLKMFKKDIEYVVFSDLSDKVVESITYEMEIEEGESYGEG